MTGRWRAVALAGAGGLLVGCASAPTEVVPGGVPQAPVIVLPPEPTAYELNQRQRAEELTRQGELAEAALIWEVLMTIRPQVDEYRMRWDGLQRQIANVATGHLDKADQAASKGQIDAATQLYLSALALQPSNARAADGLRAVERERVRRQYLGKLSRNTLTRRAMSDAMTQTEPAPKR
jgi:hypothetical protein